MTAISQLIQISALGACLAVTVAPPTGAHLDGTRRAMQTMAASSDTISLDDILVVARSRG